MKNIFSTLFLLGLAASLLWSCKKDETKVYAASSGTTPAFTTSSTSFTLIKVNQDKNAVTFSSTKSDFGYNGIVKYRIELAKKGANFVSPTYLDLVADKAISNITKILKVSELNDLAIAAGIPANTTGDLDARVIAYISDQYAPAYSNIVTLHITTYLKESWLWVPGDYQGWSPDKAPQVYSKDGDGLHKGFVYYGSGSTEFKLTSNPDWSHTNYGDGSNGTLSTSGGNLKFPSGNGYYYIEANTATLTWKAVKTTWGVIGAAVGGWDAVNDKPLTFDAANKVWKGTIVFGDGEWKFRANQDWLINMGNNGGVLNFGGGNFTVTAGTYDVVLDLTNPMNFKYTLTKK